jgi:hypothetical protein
MRAVHFTLLVLLALAGGPALSTTHWNAAAAVSDGKDEPTPEEIIKAFSEKETEFYEAWMRYTYTQTAVIKVLSVDGVEKSNEVMMLTYEVVFNDDGSREVRKLEERNYLESVRFTDEDEQVILNLLPFALTTKDIPSYDLSYKGKERVDELDCYLFSVRPRSRGEGFRFEGNIWVDQVDLQIVRTLGRVVPPKTSRDKFPEFETLRQVVDNKYWFPAWTHGLDVLRFRDMQGSQDVEIEETITYEGYKEFITKATIRYGDKVPIPDDKK